MYDWIIIYSSDPINNMVDFASIITGMAVYMGRTAGEIITGNFLGTVGIVNAGFLITIFVIFVIVVRKAMGIITNLLLVAVASALFPAIITYVGIYTIPMTFQTIVFFVVLGIGIYIVFSIGKYILRFMGLFSGSRKQEQQKNNESEK